MDRTYKEAIRDLQQQKPVIWKNWAEVYPLPSQEELTACTTCGQSVQEDTRCVYCGQVVHFAADCGQWLDTDLYSSGPVKAFWCEDCCCDFADFWEGDDL